MTPIPAGFLPGISGKRNQSGLPRPRFLEELENRQLRGLEECLLRRLKVGLLLRQIADRLRKVQVLQARQDFLVLQ